MFQVSQLITVNEILDSRKCNITLESWSSSSLYSMVLYLGSRNLLRFLAKAIHLHTVPQALDSRQSKALKAHLLYCLVD